MPETSAALIDQLVYIDNFLNNGTGDTPQLDVDGQLSLDLAAFADDSFIFPDEDKPKDPSNGDNDENNFTSSNGHNDKNVPEMTSPLLNDISTSWLNSNEHHPPFDYDSARQAGQKALASINLKARNGAYLENALNANDQDQKDERAAEASAFHQNSQLNEQRKLRQSTINEIIPDLSHVPKFPVPPGAESSLRQAGLTHNQIDLLSALIAQHQNSLGRSINGSKLGEQTSYTQNDRLEDVKSHIVETPTLLSSSGSTVERRNDDNGQRVAQRGRLTNAVESPASITSNYSSGYSSGGNSVLSTPQTASRGSISGGSNGNNAYNELDKRKRNTAASARFRIKKKMREKEMEIKIQQLDDLIKEFEIKITELEMENRLLKNLIIEKGNQKSSQELLSLKEKAQRK